jgi:hypothetical protein
MTARRENTYAVPSSVSVDPQERPLPQAPPAPATGDDEIYASIVDDFQKYPTDGVNMYLAPVNENSYHNLAFNSASGQSASVNVPPANGNVYRNLAFNSATGQPESVVEPPANEDVYRNLTFDSASGQPASVVEPPANEDVYRNLTFDSATG